MNYTRLSAAAIWNLKNFPSAARRLEKVATNVSRGAELSRQLRGSGDGFLTQRRGIAALSLVAIGALGFISLYQMGLIKHLPEPRLPKLDSDRVDGSAEAYKRFATPDGVLGINSYALTMALAAMGGKDRARQAPWIPLALAGKVGFDLTQVSRMVRVQWRKYKAFSFWSLLSGAATLATAGLAFGEVREALREVLRRGRINSH